MEVYSTKFSSDLAYKYKIGWQYLLATNTLAYFVEESIMKKKALLNLPLTHMDFRNNDETKLKNVFNPETKS